MVILPGNPKNNKVFSIGYGIISGVCKNARIYGCYRPIVGSSTRQTGRRQCLAKSQFSSPQRFTTLLFLPSPLLNRSNTPLWFSLQHNQSTTNKNAFREKQNVHRNHRNRSYGHVCSPRAAHRIVLIFRRRPGAAPKVARALCPRSAFDQHTSHAELNHHSRVAAAAAATTAAAAAACEFSSSF